MVFGRCFEKALAAYFSREDSEAGNQTKEQQQSALQPQ
jgi:hypothetical protein